MGYSLYLSDSVFSFVKWHHNCVCDEIIYAKIFYMQMFLNVS